MGAIAGMIDFLVDGTAKWVCLLTYLVGEGNGTTKYTLTGLPLAVDA